MNNGSPSLAPPMVTRRPGRWWRAALWASLLLGALALCAAFTLIDLVDPAPVRVIVDGTPLLPEFNLAAMHPVHKLGLAIGVAVALLVALLVVFGGVVVALVAMVPVLLLVLLVVIVPMLMGVAAVLALLSPLLLVAWLAWRVLRRTPPSSTMAA